MTFPDPLNDRPSISSEMGILRTSPVNLQCVCRYRCRSTLEDLDHSSSTGDLEHLTAALLAVPSVAT